jgi:hypothetical protein
MANRLLPVHSYSNSQSGPSEDGQNQAAFAAYHQLKLVANHESWQQITLCESLRHEPLVMIRIDERSRIQEH